MADNLKPILGIARRFTTDAQVRSVFGDHSWATAEFVSDVTTHKELATSMLLDPACALTLEHCPLHALTTNLKRADVADAALAVRHASLQPEARQKSTVLHRIKFPHTHISTVVEHCSNVIITVSEYSVPVAYKLLGEIPGSEENEYVVRVIWERHRCARAEGKIVATKDELQQTDLAFINIVQKLQDEKSKQPGDPLPIVFGLASFILSKRQIRPGSMPEDIRAFLTCDEMGVDVEVLNVVENTLANRTSASALHQTDFVPQKVTEKHLIDALQSAMAMTHSVDSAAQRNDEKSDYQCDMPALTESDDDDDSQCADSDRTDDQAK